MLQAHRDEERAKSWRGWNLAWSGVVLAMLILALWLTENQKNWYWTSLLLVLLSTLLISVPRFVRQSRRLRAASLSAWWVLLDVTVALI